MPLKTANKKLISNYGIMPAIAILIILAPFGYSIMSNVASTGNNNQDVFLEMPDPKYTECVKETEYMRYHHWELLRSTREEVVRYGIRGEINLNKCKECHTSRDHFCNRCHNAVSLTPDCFDCHYYP